MALWPSRTGMKRSMRISLYVVPFASNRCLTFSSAYAPLHAVSNSISNCSRIEVNAVVFDDQDWCSQTLLLFAFGLGYSFELCIIWSTPLEELLLGRIERYLLLFPSH